MAALNDHMDLETCYEWGALFASPWPELVDGMRSRAVQMGMRQENTQDSILWLEGDQPRVKFCFLPDPSEIEAVRRIYNDDSSLEVPVCFVFVRQPDDSETRGEIIFVYIPSESAELPVALLPGVHGSRDTMIPVAVQANRAW